MVNPKPDDILEHVRRQRRELLGLIQKLVEIESPSPRIDSHRRIEALLATELQALDYRVRRTSRIHQPGHVFARPARRRSGSPIQLVIGHYDTVWPVGTLAKRPFTVDENKAHGPGVFDMKGGLAQLIIALRTLRELSREPAVTPVIFINSDEEIGSRNSTRFIRALARCAERAYVLEPAMGVTGNLKTARKGVGKFTITVYGKAGRAGLDCEGGASAILELSHVIQKLFRLNDPTRGVTVNVGTIDGGLHPNVIAPVSQAIVDVRVTTIDDGKRLEQAIYALEAASEGVRLRIEGGIGRPSMEATPRNNALWLRAEELGRQLGFELKQSRAGGASDGNTASQYTATLDGLGPVGDGARAEHEFLYIDKTLERTALLAHLLLLPQAAAMVKGDTTRSSISMPHLTS